MTEYNLLTAGASLKDYKCDTNSAYGQVKTEAGEDFNIDVLKFSNYKDIVKNTQEV